MAITVNATVPVNITVLVGVTVPVSVVTSCSWRVKYFHVTSRDYHITSRIHDSNVIFTVLKSIKIKSSIDDDFLPSVFVDFVETKAN